jgi:nicotinamidase-related amidase
VRKLFNWARKEKVPVISTVLRVRKGDTGPLASVPHCVDGTVGEQKAPKTALPRRINLGLRNTTDLPDRIFEHYPQVIFEKRDTDIFAHARLERLITEMPLATFIICGAGLAGGILQAAIGLRNRGFSVVVAEDAVLALGNPMAEMARRRMEAKGVVFAKTDEITLPRPRRRRRYVPMREAMKLSGASRK